MNPLTVIVTWMDGRQEIYACVEFNVKDGVLVIHEATGSDWHFPLANIRVFKPEW